MGAITDLDLFVLAINADLLTWDSKMHLRPEGFEFESLADATSVLKGNAVPVDSGWVFEPGAFDDHPDYAYVGHQNLAEGLAPRPANGTAWDTGHSMRWGAWLTSFSDAGDAVKPGGGQYFKEMRSSLSDFFFKHVVRPPTSTIPIPTTANFMDGRDGLYRYNPKNKTGNIDISGQTVLLFYGWWILLDTVAARDLYAQLEQLYPYPETVRKAFWTSKTDFYVRLASKLNLTGHLDGGDADPQDLAMFKSTISPILSGKPWSSVSAQQDSYRLLVPLFFAFRNNVQPWQAEFSDMLAHYSNSGWKDQMREGYSVGRLLDKLSFWYLASEFIVLAKTYDHASLIPANLPSQLHQFMRQLWLAWPESISETGWGEPKFTNFKQYLSWAIKQRHPWTVGPH